MLAKPFGMTRLYRALRCGYLAAALLLAAGFASAQPGLPLFTYLETKEMNAGESDTVLMNKAVSNILVASGSDAITLELPVGDGQTEVFELEPFSTLAPDSQVVTFDGISEVPVEVDVQAFRGAARSKPDLRGFLAVLNPDEVMGMIWGPGQETLFIAPEANQKGSGLHSVGAESAFESEIASVCGHVDAAVFSPDRERLPGKGGETLLVQVMVDVAHDVYRNTFGSNSADAGEVVLGMFAAVSEVYLATVNVRVVPSKLVIWNVPDSFNGANSDAQLDVYAAFCKSNRSTINRDVAYLLDDGTDYAGIAGIGALCDVNRGYGIVNLPVLSPTVRTITLAHEMGHSFGSPHTHCYSPPIDCCYTDEPCATCSFVSPQVSTIMSYCHTITGGSRIFQFHDRVKQVLRAGAENATCVNVSPPLVGSPSLVSPADGESVPGNSVTLVWNSVPNATGYQAQVATNPSFTNASATDVLSGTSFTSSSLTNSGTTYYWRVRAGNAAGWSGWSAARNFTNGSTVTIPASPVLSSPDDGANVPGASVPLVWSASPGATLYEVQHSRSADFSSPWTSPQTSATTINWNNLPSTGGTYYWRVRAGNSAGWSNWSPGRHFVNGSSVPAPVVPGRVKPAEGEVVSGVKAYFEWTSVSGATEYQNEVAFNPSFSPVWATTPEDWTQNHVQWSPMPNNGTTIYWRVRAGNAGGWSAWSPTWSFVSGETLGIPTRVKPAEGEVVPGVNAVLEWTSVTGATKYGNELSLNPSFSPVWRAAPADWALSHAQWPAMPNNGTTIYWRVRAGNDTGWSGWSPTWSFVSGSGGCTTCQPVDVDGNGEISDAEFSPVLTKWLNGAADAPSDVVLSSALSLWLNGGCYNSSGSSWATRPCK